ncbi:phosphatidate cytidylyltransferase [Pseudorhodoplanes sp.]|jgi:phosphatidate cytidylyltransferase|uniref:phosphatidate cytidylyltransferase n=1 Tax=Pseudorhodoplanes sp. TaxID=1934341 RepID=UPI002C33539C|nr:phosphatidate cytidylyltransferase [Pseudorhodoplanes sp.]HWV42298.1 phosphatidate cytidylyltransferase [Pseudorhodoplanes sp.]
MDGGKPSLPLTETTSTPSTRNLMLRIASAAVLAPLAIGAAWLGSWPFTIFWTIAAVAVWWEWIGLVEPTGRNVLLATGICALLLQAIVFETGNLSIAIMIVALGVLAGIVTAGKHAPAVAGGLLYASALLMAAAVLRADDKYGFIAILFLFAVVWGTDIGGYFSGRAFGGPKLAPSISPKKTWSGAIGGTLVGVGAAVAVAKLFTLSNPLMIGIVAVVLSVASQCGDLFESGLKRRFDAKDASGLIPGHGGVMDRLDGFIFAVTVAAVIGVARGGFDGPAAGLLVW